jgi:thiol-disulfide isomerase/thioredoxin
MLRRLLLLRTLLPRLPLLLALCAGLAQAQSQTPRLTGSTLDGQRFALDALRGKVVMLFFWNTDCVPCIQKMPELRANAAGWRGKPFELVLVSTDRDRAAALGYLQTLRQVDKGMPALTALWSGDLVYAGGWAAPVAVPLTLVIDANGAIAARHAGRISDETWDEVAGLLP